MSMNKSSPPQQDSALRFQRLNVALAAIFGATILACVQYYKSDTYHLPLILVFAFTLAALAASAYNGRNDDPKQSKNVHHDTRLDKQKVYSLPDHRSLFCCWMCSISFFLYGLASSVDKFNGY